uniref:Uncharacterized protein n=1 Tax=Candidatus Kentrum sp. FW TaxID=2126338 RepID=A0A450TXU3_9GAMM|nr:MAG: hypothetical protein BECKFW1821C_GA0114237_10607 [Candidatus Kentron sp. FW]
MVFAGNDNERVILHFVHKPMFLRNSSRPIPLQFVFEWFRFPEPDIWLSKCIGNQVDDALVYLFVGRRLVGEIIERAFFKGDFHG